MPDLTLPVDELVQSFAEEAIEDLAGDIGTMIAERIVTPVVGLIEARVRARLAELLDQLKPPPPTRKPSGARRAAKPERAVGSTGKTHKSKREGRAGNSCSKCGAVGFTARTCGKTHNVKGGAKKAAPDEDDEPEPAPRTRTIAELIEKSSIGRGLKNIRENGIDAELADLDREMHDRHRPPPRSAFPYGVKAQPNGKLRAIDTTTVAIGARETCPHGNGSAASCSQCVLGAAKVKTVAIVGGQVVVDGAAVRSTKEHTVLAAAASAPRPGRKPKGLEAT